MDQELSTLLARGDTHGTAALVGIVDRLGAEALAFDPVVLEMTLRSDMGVELDPGVEDRFHAAASMLTTNLVSLSAAGFCQVVRALNFKAVDPSYFIPADLEDVVNGCAELRLLTGSDDFGKLDFSHDVRRYVGALLENNGITSPPKLLSFAEYDPERLDSRNLALSSDAFMNEVYMRSQEEKTDAIQERCDQIVTEVLTQIASLKLRNGDGRSLDEFLKKLNRGELHER